MFSNNHRIRPFTLCFLACFWLTWSWVEGNYSFSIRSLKAPIRFRHLKYSVANWKFCWPSFDLLGKFIQGQQLLGQFWTPRFDDTNWPWIPALGRSAESRQNFQFGTDNFKRRPLLTCLHLLNFLYNEKLKYFYVASEVSFLSVFKSISVNKITIKYLLLFPFI